MPISGYYHGHGSEVMSDMTKRYGAKKGKEVFYAKANKVKGMKPISHMPKGAGLSPKGDIGANRCAEMMTQKHMKGASKKSYMTMKGM